MADLKTAITKAKAKELLSNDKAAAGFLEKVKTLNSWKTFFELFPLLFKLNQSVVYVVEMVQKEYSLCTEEERIDVAAELMDDLIAFRGWMTPIELVDGTIWKAIISSGVQALNGKFGSGPWYQTIGLDLLHAVGVK